MTSIFETMLRPGNKLPSLAEQVIELAHDTIAQAASQWIDVKDRLPGEYQRVLTYRANLEGDENKTNVGYLRIKNGFHCNQGGLLDDDLYPHTLVTHWMPLPNPPEPNKESL